MLGKCLIFKFCKEVTYTYGILKHSMRLYISVFSVRRIAVVDYRESLFYIDNCINSETCQSLIKPPVDHCIDFFTNLRIFPVEIRLLFVEEVKIVFICTGDLFPCTAAEVRTPVVRLLAVFTLFNIEIFTVLTVRVSYSFFKPLMFIRTVIYHKVHKDVHISFFSLCQKLVHIIHISEYGIYIVVV